MSPTRPNLRAGFAEAAFPFAAGSADAAIADACALIVFFLADGRGMSKQGMAAMRGRVLVSPVTVWELTRKAADGTLPTPLTADASTWLDFIANRGFEIVPLSWASAAGANDLPLHHRDPFDRMLIATALNEALPIITSDRAFAAYGVPTLW